MADVACEVRLPRRLRKTAVLAGLLSALVGAGHLAAWLGGYLSQRGLSGITMKTNTALCLTLVGVGLMLVVLDQPSRVRRWMARFCAASALVLGTLTLAENLMGWDFGIDQLLAVEMPGALAVTSPNRMGLPASTCITLIGSALFILSRRDGRGVQVAQAMALTVCLLSLLAIIGFLYGAEQFYGIARYTGIAWPTAAALLLLGVGLLCARPTEGLMAQVTANDPGGVNIRRLLPFFIVLPLLLGWLRLAGEREGVFDAATGTGLTMLLFIVIFSTLTYGASRQAGRSARALDESRQRLVLAKEAAGLGIQDYDIRSGRIRWDERIREFWGVEANTEITLDVFLAGVHPDDRAAVQAVVDRALDPGGTRRYDLEHRVISRRDGVERWVAVMGDVFFDGKHATRMVGTIQDITERKRAEHALHELNTLLESKVIQRTEELRRERKRLYDVLETLPVMTCLLTADHQIVFANRSFRERFGEAQGRPCYESCFGQQQPCDFCQTYEVLKTGRPHRWEVRCPDGKTIIDAHDFPFTDVDGSRLVLEMDVDITERKRVEAALQELNKTLKHRTTELEHRSRQLQRLTLQLSQAEDRERKRIAAILHEDLQQQIAGARFHLGLLNSRTKDNPKQEAIVASIDETLRDAIEKSRNLSHELSPAVLYQNDLVEALRWLASHMRTKHGLTVYVDACEGMCLRSDALTIFLFRAAQELLFNVIKHSGTREATIRACRRGRFVRLLVSDQGRGFEERALAEPAGFGLLSIRERTETLGGRMRIRSVVGKGSVFQILVPENP